MTEFGNLGEGLDQARVMNAQMTSNAKAAAEQLLDCGQQIQVRLAHQASGARERLVACFEDLVRAPDAGSAAQVSASYIVASMRAYSDDLTQWNQFFQQACQRGLEELRQGVAARG